MLPIWNQTKRLHLPHVQHLNRRPGNKTQGLGYHPCPLSPTLSILLSPFYALPHLNPPLCDMTLFSFPFSVSGGMTFFGRVPR